MKKLSAVLIIFTMTLIFNGCIIFHSISYTINLETPTSGTATIVAHDIRSNAAGDEEFEQDKKNLFSYMLKSDQFLEDRKKEGKDIIDRQLTISGDTLNGKATFKFSNINKVEAIQFEDGFYYLTLALEDSVISTNGQIIRSKDMKRILWDKTAKILKFEMLSFSYDKKQYRPLAPYYKQQK